MEFLKFQLYKIDARLIKSFVGQFSLEKFMKTLYLRQKIYDKNKNLIEQRKVGFVLNIRNQKAGIGEQVLESMQNLCIFGLNPIFLILIFLRQIKKSFCYFIGLVLLIFFIGQPK